MQGRDESSPQAAMSDKMNEKIAIIGIGCKFPGANNLEEFWKVLRDGENHVIEIPTNRWFHEAVYDEDFNTPAKTHARKAGFLKDHLAFDNTFFNIKDVESNKMDPQQRYVLECTHMALEDAGITREQIKGSRTSVYVGAMNTDYKSEFNSTSAVPDSYTVTGVSSSIISNRVAYVYDLRGAAVTIDTACSSSLVAVHLAIQALRAGDCDMVFCGGTNSILTPDVFIHLSKARMVSAKGQCFAFSDQVDGYTRGEGCGIVILKRLQDAQRDNNKVWAIIESGCNQDGGTVAPMSKPSGEQQTQLLEDVYRKSNIDPRHIDYIEAHGTGTPVGDVIEVNALGKFFKKTKSERHRYLGSVKTNIGHLESAAGMAGLVKVLLMMKHSKIVPSLHFQNPNPNIDFKGMHLSVPTELVAWETVNKVACVSSFGFGGTNCHAVVESYEKPTSSNNVMCPTEINSDQIVCFSGMNLESLKGSMKDFQQYPDVETIDIRDLSFTSTLHRDHFPVRQAFVADSTENLMSQVTDHLEHLKHDQSDTKKPNIVFVFSGMGTAWAGMGKDFIMKNIVFRNTVREIDTFLAEFVTWSVEERLYMETDMSDQLFWPIAIFSCQVALAKLWQSLGVIPACVVGYSVGEVAAAHVAGYLTLSDAVKVIYHRTKVLSKLVGVGKMILFKGVDTDIVQEVVNTFSDKANISARISPKACAVSGEINSIKSIETEMRERAAERNLEVDTIDLKLPLAYHSHCVDKAKDELRQVLNGIGTESQNTGNIDMISTVTAEKVKGPLSTEYWVNNLREPVLFFSAVKKTIEQNENNIFFEVGPKPLLRSHAKDIFPEENVKVIVSMSTQSKWNKFLEAVALAYKHGCSLTWTSLIDNGRSVTPIPRYSFSYRRFLQSSETTSMIMAGHNFLKKTHPFVFKVESTDRFNIFLTTPTFRSVYDHNVSGNLIIPGAVYLECGFALSKTIPLRNAVRYSVSATFEQPCLFTDKEPVVFSLEMNKVPFCNEPNIRYDSYIVDILQGHTLFAKISLSPSSPAIETPIFNIPEIKNRCQKQVDRKQIYQSLAAFGFMYGPFYKLLKTAFRNAEECIAEMSIPDGLAHEIPGTTVHPSILDAMIQTYIIITDSEEKKTVLPLSVGKVTSYRETEDTMFIHTKVKQSYGDLIVFDSKLMTPGGELIVEMENLALKFLATKEEAASTETITKNLYRCSWILKELDYPKTVELDQNVLYISNESVPPDVTSIDYTTDYDRSDAITEELNLLKQSQILHLFKYIIFNINISNVSKSEEAANIQTRIVNLCMALKTVFCYPLKIPVYVFTRWALSDEHSQTNAECVNPAMTAVWGMIRSALLEQSADITVFDLHLPLPDCTLQLMTSVSEFVNRSNDLKRFKEWLVTENSLFISHIVPLVKNHSLPLYRCVSSSDHENVIQVCNGTINSPDTFSVYMENTDSVSSKNHSKITVNEQFLQHPKLFEMSVPYSTMDQSKTHLGSGNVVFSLEATGTVEDVTSGEKHHVISCYPCPVGSNRSVPTDAIVHKDIFQNYSPGDLTRLITLMYLADHIPGTSVSILISSQTRAVGEVLHHMLTANDHSFQTRDVDLVTTEDVQNGKNLKNTLVSLILIDNQMASPIIQKWPNGEYFVTLAALINQNVKSLVTFHLPRVELITMHTSDIFQHPSILTQVLKVKEWLKDHKALVPENLGTETELNGLCPKGAADLSDLLKVDSVKVDQNSLFKKDAVYIVVGGLTGLGWIFVKYLSSKGAGNIAILNRRIPSEEMNDRIAVLSASENCNIRCFQCDVTSYDSVENVFAIIRKTFCMKPLKGVFFGAVVKGDAVLSNVTKESFDSVMSPKVKGTWNMHILTQNLTTLDYFVLLSSITAILGNFGQTCYGTANAFMDGLISYRRFNKLPGQVINWGPLATGMLMENEKAKKVLAERGMNLLQEADISDLITPILLLNREQTVACNFDSDKWSKNQLVIVAGTASHGIPISDDLLRDLQKAPKLDIEKRIEIYMRLLIVMSARVLGVEEQQIKPDSDLQGLGMDSLLAMTIRNEIFKITQCRLPAVVLVSGDVTVRIIAETLDAEVQKELAN